jgi:hypothetical protein
VICPMGAGAETFALCDPLQGGAADPDLGCEMLLQLN